VLAFPDEIVNRGAEQAGAGIRVRQCPTRIGGVVKKRHALRFIATNVNSSWTTYHFVTTIALGLL
jgi:hypothetical protein